MINSKEAYSIIRKAFPKDVIEDMAELPNCYIFGITSNIPERIGRCGYDIVDKTSGKVGFIHITDYAKYVDNGEVKEIKLPIK